PVPFDEIHAVPEGPNARPHALIRPESLKLTLPLSDTRLTRVKCAPLGKLVTLRSSVEALSPADPAGACVMSQPDPTSTASTAAISRGFMVTARGCSRCALKGWKCARRPCVSLEPAAALW